MTYSLVHAVTVKQPGQAKGTEFHHRYAVPFDLHNGLRISTGEDGCSFVIEDLSLHLDTATYTCRTVIETSEAFPMDDALHFYRELGYEVVR